MPARNRRIAHAVLEGEALCNVGRRHGLSPQRVAQITAAFARDFGFNEPFTRSVYVLRARYQEKLEIQVSRRQKTA